jgi:pilus assembly protein FimV
VLVLLLSSEVWAVGLGDIKLNSALNEPLRAEISLLSATPEELASLSISLASSDIFDRYGIDRPFYLQEIEFNLADGGVVLLRSRNPITEPFLTFLVEATWPSGRLLREYTVLLDPPTFTPVAAQQAPSVTAPSRSAPADSGRIERQQPAAQPQPSRPAEEPRPAPQTPQTPQTPQPAQTAGSAPVDDTPYDTSGGRDYLVQRNDTLWGIASRMRPDGRLTMNQTMVAIFEANPGAFGGNINLLRAGASLRIPSADEIFQISRGNAFSEVKRQNEAWSSGYMAPPPPPAETRPSLTLVPPDEEPAGVAYDDDLDTAEPLTREQELENRITELESADVPDQPSLLQIRDDELAALRQELANIRGEVYEPPVEDIEGPFVGDQADDEVPADDAVGVDELAPDGVDELAPDQPEPAADDAAADDAVVEDTAVPTTVIRTEAKSEPGIVDKIFGALTSVWAGIAAALLLVAGLLFWFMRRGGDEVDEAVPWQPLDSDEMEPASLASTERMHAPTPDEAIVVVEQDSAIRAMTGETAEIPAAPEIEDATVESSGMFASIEDTFSSDTAVNLDQTDPIAEADFHMAYGLYDQAADLINGALESEPEDTSLMSKLCEIYFVWGNRDAFVDAARNLESAVGDGGSSDWDKTVIMGQQIAPDHELFAGADVGAATQAVDLAFDAEPDEAGALDIDFGGTDTGVADAIDLGAGESDAESGDLDFLFDESTAESPTIETAGTEETVAMPAQEDTVESPTIDQQVGDLEGTSELPSLDETVEQAIVHAGQESEATAEINLDDLDLDIGGLAETELASFEDLDATSEHQALADLEAIPDDEALADDEAIPDDQAFSDDVFTDTGAETGRNPEIDPNSTGVREGLDLEALMDPDATGEMRLASDETGRSPLLDDTEDALDETEVSIDESLLDSTGLTQVLSDDVAVDTSTGVEDVLSDDQATLHASLDEDEGEFDFASTEALPVDVFEPDAGSRSQRSDCRTQGEWCRRYGRSVTRRRDSRAARSVDV